MKRFSLPFPRWLLLVLLGYVILAAIYSISTPIFEPPDEVFHFSMIDHIADHGSLPVQQVGQNALWQQEGSQPPLYYGVSALLVKFIDRSDLLTRQARNPHVKIGIGSAQHNYTLVKHDWDAEGFPWSGTTLAVHVLRFFSIALGSGTVIAIYYIARLTAPRAPAIHITAVLIAAFNPMFLFISSAVNNDNLVNLLSAITLALLLQTWRTGLTQKRTWTLGIMMAASSLAKLSGLVLYPTAAVVMILVMRREKRSLRDQITAAEIILIAWMLIAGWWYARNVNLYGDPTGTNRMVEIAGARQALPTVREGIEEFNQLRMSFWGVFGQFNVLAPELFYHYGDVLLLAPLIGGLVYTTRVRIALKRSHSAASLPPGPIELGAARRSDIVPVLILMLHTLIVFVALAIWTRRTYASQGRLMFPALGALATLIALGLAQWFPSALRRFMTPAAALPMVFAAWIVPFHTILPAYTPPQTVPALPDDAIPLNVRFDTIELLGIHVSDHIPDPGDQQDGLHITLYWRPRAHTPTDLSFFVQALGLPDDDTDSRLQEIGRIASYPGGGLLRTTQWTLNKIYADTLVLPISQDARTPVQPVLNIGWWDVETGIEVAPTTADGAPLPPVAVSLPENITAP